MFTFGRSGFAGLLAAVTFAVTPSFAASPATDSYLANVRLKIDVLIASSRLAGTMAQSDELRRFAADEARHQEDALAALDGWHAGKIAALETPVETGRSVDPGDVAIDASRFVAPEGTGALMPAAAMTLEHLSALKDAAFEDAYRSVETNVLTDLAGFYEAYSLTGDDAALRTMAGRELPEVRAEQEAIGKL